MVSIQPISQDVIGLDLMQNQLNVYVPHDAIIFKELYTLFQGVQLTNGLQLTSMLKGDGKFSISPSLITTDIKNQLADAVGNYHNILENCGDDY